MSSVWGELKRREADRSFFNDYWARYGSSDLNADFVAWVAEGLPVDE